MLSIDNRICIEISKQEVCHYIGYDTSCKIPARISSLIDEYIECAHYLIEPDYSYNVRDVDWIQGSTVVLEGSIIFESRVLANILEQCHKVVVFLTTIGKNLEDMVCRLSVDGHVLQATILDTIGSIAIDRLVDSVQDRIEMVAGAQEFIPSQRFSPGYCGWDLNQQKQLFQVVDNNKVGVRLNDECLMIPQKSVSGIVGIGLSGGSIGDYKPCEICGKYACMGRR